MRHSLWQRLLRIAVPNWRFFEEPGPTPNLSYRSGSVGAWLPLACSQGTNSVLLNPYGNLQLAQRALVDRFLQQPDDPVSYQLLERMVGVAAVQRGFSRFQFRIEVEGEEAYRSAPTEVDTP